MSEVVPSPSIVVFKSLLGKALSDLAWFHCWPCYEGALELPFNWDYPTTLMSSCLPFIPFLFM